MLRGFFISNDQLYLDVFQNLLRCVSHLNFLQSLRISQSHSSARNDRINYLEQLSLLELYCIIKILKKRPVT